MNSVNLIGRLTKAIEVNYTQSGLAVASFSLAVNRPFKNQETGQQEADFIQCVAWREKAENLAKMTAKGSLVGITGRIQTRNYENNQGQKVFVTEIMVDNFHLVETKEQTDQRRAQDQGQGYNQHQQNNYQANNQGGYSGQQQTQQQPQAQYQHPQQNNQATQQTPQTNHNTTPQQGNGQQTPVAGAQSVDIQADDLPF